jgi:hypothetical protein
VFSVDLRRLRQALAAARRTQLDPAVAATLAQAGEAYGGVLLASRLLIGAASGLLLWQLLSHPPAWRHPARWQGR